MVGKVGNFFRDIGLHFGIVKAPSNRRDLTFRSARASVLLRIPVLQVDKKCWK